MISGVPELRHNFRGKLLKFRSGWQLCKGVAQQTPGPGTNVQDLTLAIGLSTQVVWIHALNEGLYLLKWS